MTGGPVLVTGANGLIGATLVQALTNAGTEVRVLDLRAQGEGFGDVRDLASLQPVVAECRGIVHLAAVSRVVDAELSPERCWATNVLGLLNLLSVIRAQRRPPWLVFASSREVYGNQTRLPVAEDAAVQPINTYATSKVIGERLIASAVEQGLRAMTVRFSNVYGRTDDYADRVIPAFVRAALAEQPLHVRGGHQSFDFTQVDDVVRGLAELVQVMNAAVPLPPALHFVGGRPMSLARLALLVKSICNSRSMLIEEPASGLHVSSFVGCGRLAREWLGWSAQTSVETGVAALMRDFQADQRSQATKQNSIEPAMVSLPPVGCAVSAGLSHA
jgi:UDP-glucose 4-epimerase